MRQPTVITFLQKRWFLIGIFFSSLLAYFNPAWGEALRSYDIFSIAIFFSFLATGLALETENILRQIKGVWAPVAATLSSLILYPAIAWLLALPLLPHEFVVGVCIIATGPVTISSGTIMTAIARGNVPLSLVICVLTNLLAIFTIPILLNLLLNVSSTVDLPVAQMLGDLVVKVLLPLVLGQIVRPLFKRLLSSFISHLSIFQSCIILMIIFNAVSSSAESIDRAGSSIAGVSIFIIFLHFFMMAVNYGVAALLKLDRASTVAVTIHASQKTLTVTYLVWAEYFAAAYPMAFIPAIICQLTQMTVGTVIVDFFRKYEGSACLKMGNTK